jgi:hypothetical protein
LWLTSGIWIWIWLVIGLTLRQGSRLELGLGYTLGLVLWSSSG